MWVFVLDPHPHITLTEGTKPIKTGAFMDAPMSLLSETNILISQLISFHSKDHNIYLFRRFWPWLRLFQQFFALLMLPPLPNILHQLHDHSSYTKSDNVPETSMPIPQPKPITPNCNSHTMTINTINPLLNLPQNNNISIPLGMCQPTLLKN